MTRNPMNPTPATNIDWYDKFIAMEREYIRAQDCLKVKMRENAKLQRMIDDLLAQPGHLYTKTGSPDRPQSPKTA